MIQSHVPVLTEKDSSVIRQKVFDTVAKNWFGMPIPLEQATIKQVFQEIQALGSTLTAVSNAESVFKSHMKLFAILFFNEVYLLQWTC